MAMAMTTAVVSPPTVSASGGTNSKRFILHCEKLKSFGNGYNSQFLICKKSMHFKGRRNFSVRAEYSDGSRGGGGDFVAGFLLGGAVFGTLAYIFAPQIRRSLLNEDEYGFQKPKRPMYYDEGLENTRHTLNAKISQLNSAIDSVSSRLRGGNNAATDPTEVDSEIEAAM